MKVDTIEFDPQYKKQFEEVEKILAEEFKGKRHIFGICHRIWARKKYLLKEKYNIDWRSPAELNPGIMFD